VGGEAGIDELLAAERTGDDVVLRLASAGRVTCRAARRWRLTDGARGELRRWRDHVLLWEETEPREELYFAEAPQDALGLLGELYLRHRDAVGRWVPLERYVRPDEGVRSLVELLQAGRGRLAAGPATLIAAYATALQRQGMEPSRVPVPTEAAPGPVEALTIGDAFVVATEFVTEPPPGT
jgi:hypothetical protein